MKPKRICLVTTDLVGPVKNGGVGTATSALAKLYAESGHQVTVLFCKPYTTEDYNFDKWQRFYLQLGINLISLSKPQIEINIGHPYPRLAYAIFLSLRNQQFDSIIFPDMHGLGYYCLLAKKSGLNFLNTNLFVVFHGPTFWAMTYNCESPRRLQDLSLNYIERKSIELADRVIFPTNSALSICREMKITPNKKAVILLPGFTPQRENRKVATKKINEIIFFGRLETRKGLETFVSAVTQISDELLSRRIKITLLGMHGKVGGISSQIYLNQWRERNDIWFDVKSNLNQKEAVDYLANSEALVVIPSESETMGYTLLEALSLNLPVICSDISAFKEIQRKFLVKNLSQFKTGNNIDLAKEILSAIKYPRPTKATNFAITEKVTKKLWLRLVTQKSAKNDVIKKFPSVSVCIPFKDRPIFLRELLESLKNQTVPPKEVLLYDDGSQHPRTHAFITDIKKNFDAPFVLKIFQGEQSLGPSSARNFLARKAKCEYLLFKDDDNISFPQEIEWLLKTANARKSKIVVSPFIRFKDQFEIQSRKTNRSFLNYWIPIGDSPDINFYENVIGDCNFLINKKAFLTLHGFNIKLQYGEDRDILLRAHLKGESIAICPNATFLYREHDSNLSKVSRPQSTRSIFARETAKLLMHPSLQNLNELFNHWVTIKEPVADKKPLPRFVNPLRHDEHSLTSHKNEIWRVKAEDIQNEVRFFENQGCEIILDNDRVARFDFSRRNHIYASHEHLFFICSIRAENQFVIRTNSPDHPIILVEPGTFPLKIQIPKDLKLDLRFSGSHQSIFISPPSIVATKSQLIELR